MATRNAWEEEGPSVAPFRQEVKMFELAKFNVFIPDIKKGGVGHFWFLRMCWQAMGLGGMESVGRT